MIVIMRCDRAARSASKSVTGLRVFTQHGVAERADLPASRGLPLGRDLAFAPFRPAIAASFVVAACVGSLAARGDGVCGVVCLTHNVILPAHSHCGSTSITSLAPRRAKRAA